MWKGQGSNGLVEPSGATPEQFIRSQIALPEACARPITLARRVKNWVGSRLDRFTVFDGKNCCAFTWAAFRPTVHTVSCPHHLITPIVKLVVALRMPEFVLRDLCSCELLARCGRGNIKHAFWPTLIGW
jgi:hypothetical protein